MGDSNPLAIRLRRWWRFGPLYLALRAAGVAGMLLARFRRWHPRRPGPWQSGISILIPERGTPELLAETLAAADAAACQFDEPAQIVVVVNGAASTDYADLVARYAKVEWQFHAQPLGFNGAIEAGLRVVRHDWVYLLNSDMRLAPDAIAQLLPYRTENVFGLTSQIFFADASRRREETGWSDFAVVGAEVRMFEREPEPGDLARGNLYPGGGSSLLRTEALRNFLRATRGFKPFYWEDADWGARAWAEGMECWFVPRSHAWHHHRGTVRRYYDPAEVERVFARNALQFELRQHWTSLTSKSSIVHLSAQPEATQLELSRSAVAFAVFRRRLAARRLRDRGFDYELIRSKFRAQRESRPKSPRVLLITPFAIYPPSHGGARRIAEIGARLCAGAEVMLLSDERTAYGAQAQAEFSRYASVHLIEGRGDRPGQALQDLPTRIARHAYPRLRAELRRLIAVHRPGIVQVEHMELAALAEERQGNERWVLSLHDVYLDGSGTDAAQRAQLARFDALIACSAEDAALIGQGRVALIPNGATDRLAAYTPSPDGPRLLFIGPFRYEPNRLGILEFLRQAWPRIRTAAPSATITILGGSEAASQVGIEPLLTAPGVELVTRFVDPAPYLSAATLSVNPQLEIRGSALKLVESLLAGRCCVSTRAGARGFLDCGLSGLALSEDIASMADAVLALARDRALRHGSELPARAAIQRFTWDGAAENQLALYRELLAPQGTASP
jgi:GT2 family glycosyltransferase